MNFPPRLCDCNSCAANGLSLNWETFLSPSDLSPIRSPQFYSSSYLEYSLPRAFLRDYTRLSAQIQIPHANSSGMLVFTGWPVRSDLFAIFLDEGHLSVAFNFGFETTGLWNNLLYLSIILCYFRSYYSYEAARRMITVKMPSLLTVIQFSLSTCIYCSSYRVPCWSIETCCWQWFTYGLLCINSHWKCLTESCNTTCM